MSDNEIKITHGAELSYVGEDGVKREMMVVRFEDVPQVGIAFRTWWDGEDELPTETKFTLTGDAFKEFSHMVWSFYTNTDKYKIEGG